MKIDVNLTGTAAAPADFDLLRSALVAAQAATPTARASRGGAPGPVATAPTFADLLADAAAAAALAHRFAAGGEGP